MNSHKSNAAQSEAVREVSLRIPLSKLMCLLYNGSLHAEDFSCIDCSSTELIRRSLLSVCISSIE
jgi:hypothetical protein